MYIEQKHSPPLYTLANVVSNRRCPATNKKPTHQP